MTISPSIKPIRTAPTGPSNGIGEIVSAAEAPMIDRMSGSFSWSAERTVLMICTSALVALREERADRPVGQARRKDGVLGRTAFALDETARDLAGGVHPLFVVDGQREELGISLALRRRQRSRAASCRRSGR